MQIKHHYQELTFDILNQHGLINIYPNITYNQSISNTQSPKDCYTNLVYMAGQSPKFVKAKNSISQLRIYKSDLIGLQIHFHKNKWNMLNILWQLYLPKHRIYPQTTLIIRNISKVNHTCPLWYEVTQSGVFNLRWVIFQ